MTIMIQYYCTGDSSYLPPDLMSQYTGKEVDKGLSVKMREKREHIVSITWAQLGLSWPTEVAMTVNIVQAFGAYKAAKTQNEGSLDQRSNLF